ncbi:MAG: type II toxin-antitoxin system HicA family toxin [Chloroflexi bacterium]|nr:type II toxin-antitoxin system HicA family toxin [Chloroflexota bacterium]
MPDLPTIREFEFVKFLRSLGFRVIRTRGSHVRLRAEDGRVTTAPVHRGRNIPKGLLRKIIREDLEISIEEFLESYAKYKGR